MTPSHARERILLLLEYGPQTQCELGQHFLCKYGLRSRHIAPILDQLEVEGLIRKRRVARLRFSHIHHTVYSLAAQPAWDRRDAG